MAGLKQVLLGRIWGVMVVMVVLVVLGGGLWGVEAGACPNCVGTVADGDDGSGSIYVHDGGTEFGMSGVGGEYDGGGSNAGTAYGYSIYYMMGTVYCVVFATFFFTVRAFKKNRPAKEYL